MLIASPVKALLLTESERSLASSGARPARTQQGLPQSKLTSVTSLADALVIKEEDLFFLTEVDGQVPLHSGHGLGLYFHDCRYLSGYELALDGLPRDALGGAAGRGFMATLALANPDLPMLNGRHPQ